MVSFSSRLAARVLPLVGVVTAQSALAQSPTLIPFNQFYQQLSSATLSAQVAKPASQVATSTAFAAMREHLLGFYAGVQVNHSFLLDGQPYDCVPKLQQPSMRQLGLKTLETPPQVPSGPDILPTAEPFAQLSASEQVDPLGNSTVCGTESFPMRRTTLDDIARFKSLHDFFQKGPDGAGRAPFADARPAASIHKYAHSYQFVSNLGGSSRHNIWNINVQTNRGEIFSLNQLWYTNNNGPVQTVEMGLQNYPQKYKTNDTVLFIYWTSDGYNSTGCYNLDCSGFVQTNSHAYLGRKFNSYSTDGGPQYTAQLTAYLQNGNWWLYLNGTAPSNAIGYYPAALFRNKPMARGANEIDYGGEVVGSTVFPPMGSGQFAQKGFGHAAFDGNIVYYPANGGASVAKLSADQRSPSCFTDVTTNASSNAGTGTHFYFGGPGGSGC